MVLQTYFGPTFDGSGWLTNAQNKRSFVSTWKLGIWYLGHRLVAAPPERSRDSYARKPAAAAGSRLPVLNEKLNQTGELILNRDLTSIRASRPLARFSHHLTAEVREKAVSKRRAPLSAQLPEQCGRT